MALSRRLRTDSVALWRLARLLILIGVSLPGLVFWVVLAVFDFNVDAFMAFVAGFATHWQAAAPRARATFLDCGATGAGVVALMSLWWWASFREQGKDVT